MDVRKRLLKDHGYIFQLWYTCFVQYRYIDYGVLRVTDHTSFLPRDMFASIFRDTPYFQITQCAQADRTKNLFSASLAILTRGPSN